jgi:hypothetical protein
MVKRPRWIHGAALGFPPRADRDRIEQHANEKLNMKPDVTEITLDLGDLG